MNRVVLIRYWWVRVDLSSCKVLFVFYSILHISCNLLKVHHMQAASGGPPALTPRLVLGSNIT